MICFAPGDSARTRFGDSAGFPATATSEVGSTSVAGGVLQPSAMQKGAVIATSRGMGQRARILTQIVGVRGWKVTEQCWEGPGGERIVPVAGYDVPADARLVLVMERRWQ